MLQFIPVFIEESAAAANFSAQTSFRERNLLLMRSETRSRYPMKTLHVTLIKHAIVAVATLSFTSALTTRAITFSDLVETPDSLSYNFSGSGSEVITPSSPLTFWQFTGFTTFSGHTGLGTYGVSMQSVRHLPDGPLVTLGDSSFTAAALGTALSDTETVVHGTGEDIYTFSITVQNNGNNQLGTFSGSFSAIHSNPTTGVPDGGSSALLLGLAGLGLVSLRRWLAAA